MSELRKMSENDAAIADEYAADAYKQGLTVGINLIQDRIGEIVDDASDEINSDAYTDVDRNSMAAYLLKGTLTRLVDLASKEAGDV